MDLFYDSLETELQERLEVYVRSLSKNKGTATRFAHEASKGLADGYCHMTIRYRVGNESTVLDSRIIAMSIKYFWKVNIPREA